MSLDGDSVGPWVLALDIGTSSVRARLHDRLGTGLDPGAAATQRYAWEIGDGAMQVPASELLSHTERVVDAAVARARADGLEIVAVAVAAFWHGLLGLDPAGEPATPVMGWGDQRGVTEALLLRDELDEAQIHARTGCFIHPSYPTVRLAWLRDIDPQLYEGVAAWVSFPEYLEERLFGSRRCSFSMASGTGLLDIHRLEWDGAWLSELGMEQAQLSPLVDAGDPLRGLRPEYARRWPELREAEWHPALGDGVCANVGSGAYGRRSPGLTIGTSAAIRSVWEAETARVPDGLWCYRLDARRWVAGRALSNGGNGIAFLRDVLAMPPRPEAADAAASMPPDSHGLTVLPFLLGERGPGWRSEREAAIVGLTQATTPPELLRAWTEAVAYRLAAAAAQLETALGTADRVLASGGALHSLPFWSGILADVLDRPVVLPAVRETTARGAALVTLERLGLLGDLADAPEPEIAAVLEPDRARHETYAAAALRQSALEAALREWQHDI